jgi:hypothetical protein
MIYKSGKSEAASSATGLEHLERGQSVFAWRSSKPIHAQSPDFQSLDAAERYQAQKQGMTLAQWRTAQVLTVNAYSELGRSTPNAGIRADQIRRGGR